MRVAAAILAAGQGTRFGGDKTRVLLKGKPLWRYSYEAFMRHPRVDGVGVICAPGSVDRIRLEAGNALFVAPGGMVRQESAFVALQEAGDVDVLLLHDGARPFVSLALISRVIEGIERAGAAAPALPVTDTIREGVVIVDREKLIAMQTPQGARVDLLRRAFASASGAYTDDLALLHNAGIEAELVAGDKRNIKITTQDDLVFASALLGPPETRTGIGYDVHSFSADPRRKLFLGGIYFEDSPGLEGHSDADVLIHAIVDALLGAAGLGDIGHHFPNTDPSHKDKDSVFFLLQVSKLLETAKWRILNIDATVIAEFPKVMKKADAIRARIGEALSLDPGRVSVKATTNEKLGAIGRGEGIAAFAVASISESA